MQAIGKLALMLCWLPALMGAEVYRWVDEHGVVNYTQRKPEHVASERLVAGRPGSPQPAAEAPHAPAGAAPAASGELTETQQRMLDNLRAAEAARQTELTQVRQHNCTEARAILARLTSTGRIRMRNADGTEEILGEDERQARIEQAQRAIAENCTNSG
jgi:hypothetical protein